MYLPTALKLKYAIQYAVYSTLKLKLTSFYCRHFGYFALSSIHQLSSHSVNKGSHLMMEPGILLPVYTLKLVSPHFI